MIVWFNNLHENLKFTHEIEINKRLNFLDVLVIKQGNRFSTRIFRKAVHPLKLMRWDSEIAIKYKRNLLKTMIYRTFKISSGHFLERDLRTLKEIFLNSGFPFKFIRKQIDEFFLQKRESIGRTAGPSPKNITFGINYINENSQKFIRKVSKLTDKFIPSNVRVRFYYKRNRTLESVFSKKFKNYSKKEGPCVYEIPCKNCPKKYIGQTGRMLAIRIKEHQQLRENSALTSHVHTTGHQMDFENTRILFNENNTIKREILELISIKRSEHMENNTGIDLILFH